MTSIYKDTADGARQALLEMSVYTADQLGTVQPDPKVKGVWMVNHKGENTASIVYLAGYPDPDGNIREENDFEDVEV